MTQSRPEGRPQMSPTLFYDDPAAAIDWLVKAFGFDVQLLIKAPDGAIAHSELTLGDGLIIVGGTAGLEAWTSPKSLGGAVTQSLYVYVDDVDGHCERAQAAGAKVFRELETQDYGDRVYGAEDCEGHLWFFGQRIDDDAWERASRDRESASS